MLTLSSKISSKTRSIVAVFMIIVIGCTPLLAARGRSGNRRSDKSDRSGAARSQKQSFRGSRGSTRVGQTRNQPARVSRTRNRSTRGSRSNSQVTVNVNKYRRQNRRGINRDHRTNNTKLSFGNRRRSDRRVRKSNHIDRSRIGHGRIGHGRSYRNRYGRRFSRRSGFSITYNSPGLSFRYGYPYHRRRRHVFISLGGYWPVGYGHRRYFWYGHYPVTYNNYSTYNYNELVALPDPEEGLEPPGQETLADRFFDEGAVAFEAGNYYMASEKFARASELAPGDIVIPFVHVQALFANEKYERAAEVLRSALMRISPDEEGIYFPRGLYKDEDTLSDQIDDLIRERKFHRRDSDLQLLLGYQLFGINEIDKSAEVLSQIPDDSKNAVAAEILFNLLEKYEK